MTMAEGGSDSSRNIKRKSTFKEGKMSGIAVNGKSHTLPVSFRHACSQHHLSSTLYFSKSYPLLCEVEKLAGFERYL